MTVYTVTVAGVTQAHYTHLDDAIAHADYLSRPAAQRVLRSLASGRPTVRVITTTVRETYEGE